MHLRALPVQILIETDTSEKISPKKAVRTSEHIDFARLTAAPMMVPRYPAKPVKSSDIAFQGLPSPHFRVVLEEITPRSA
jgi:hypothetical protein